MEKPKPTAAHRRLEMMAGTWLGNEAIHPGPWTPQGGTARARVEARLALGGFAVILDYEQEMQGRVVFTGHGVVTIDSEVDEVLMHWFDCLTGVREEFRGRFDGGRLSLTSMNEQGFARITYDYNESEMNSRMEMSENGEVWNKLFDGVYSRAD